MIPSSALAAAIAISIGWRIRPRPPRVVELLARSVTPRRRGSWRAAAGAITIAILAVAAGPFAAAAIVVLAMSLPHVQSIRATRRDARAAESAFPELVDLLVLGIKSGCTPQLAFERLAPAAPAAVRPGATAVVQRVRAGQRFATAVELLCRPPPEGAGPIARPLVDALALADRHGTPLTDVLDRVADEARAQRRRNTEAAARRLPIQLAFPLVGCTLPSFVLLTIVPLMAGTFSSLRNLAP